MHIEKTRIGRRPLPLLHQLAPCSVTPCTMFRKPPLFPHTSRVDERGGRRHRRLGPRPIRRRRSPSLFHPFVPRESPAALGTDIHGHGFSSREGRERESERAGRLPPGCRAASRPRLHKDLDLRHRQTARLKTSAFASPLFSAASSPRLRALFPLSLSPSVPAAPVHDSAAARFRLDFLAGPRPPHRPTHALRSTIGPVL